MDISRELVDRCSAEQLAIPARLNLAISAAQILVLAGVLAATARGSSWLSVSLLAVIYGVAMNSAYAMLHEAEHKLLHPNLWINDSVGTVLALFFPAPFHLLRQGHIGHHMRNRSDDEAFDYYFEGENPIWKRLQLYGILTGFFWLTIVCSNFLAAVQPRLLRDLKISFDRPSLAFQESLNSRYYALIRLEAWAAIALHAVFMWFWHIPIARYAAVLFGFGFMWSAMQYAHHFGTVRDVRAGSRDLKTNALLDRIWLNHNWHLQHHLRPTVPWIHLPKLAAPQTERGGLLSAYFSMWRGPRLTHERVQNIYAGRIVR
jgi:fatty acid desaturase